MAAHAPEIGCDCAIRICQAIEESAPIRTLVVDDSAVVLDAICRLLEMEERVEVIGRATDGREAVDAVAHHRPDLVLIDVEMPTMNGFTAAALIRSAFQNVRVVLMSANPCYDNEDEIRACGADAFIHKLEFGQVFPRILSKVTSAAPTRV